MAGFREIIRDHDVIICAGSGGVGKTTTAASLAVYAAESGKRTIVMTIDPAKRLANALGVRNLSASGQAGSVEEIGKGRLSAMMLDQKGAWDQLVERHAPSPEVREKILQNRFYAHLSEAFAGSHEYMAIEQLCQLHESGEYDLIVVDTPPTRHALDFLEAPQRLADFLDRSVVKWFVRPYLSAGWTTMQFVNRTVGFLFRRLEDATGIAALAEVSEFFTSMSGLFDNFEERVKRVYELLRAPSTGFVLVASPEEQVLKEAEEFSGQVGELGMGLRGVVFNRVHREMPGRRAPVGGDVVTALVLGCGVAAPIAAELATNFERYESLGRGDGLRMETFRQLLAEDVNVVEVPNFNSDVHSIDGLRLMHRFLFPA